MLPNRIPIVLAAAALTAGTTHLLAEEPALPATPYMGGPVELVKAPNGAIANMRILNGIEAVAWLEPTIDPGAGSYLGSSRPRLDGGETGSSV